MFKIGKNIIRIFVMTFMTIYLSGIMLISSFAATYLTDTATADFYDLIFDIRGDVIYNSNTSSSLDVKALAVYVINTGKEPINEVQFDVFDCNNTKNTHAGAKITPITSGTKNRLETEWLGVCQYSGYDDSIFQKNGSEQYVYTDMTAGNAYFAGWEIFWYPSSRSPYFHQ